MILAIFGIIAIGAALLLIYYSKNPGKGPSGASRAKQVQATVMPEKHYKKSEDGKVVYLFDDDDGDDGGDSDETSSGPDDGDGPGSGDRA
ncbi:MAG: hypothetical protein LBO70_08320 [Clostridiales Family XIII bacterium]|nr:hypothetical protein [Clostridiales Family XIII bacterium]